MSQCPTGCGRSVALGNLLCRTCWHVVPPALAADVWRTWRAFNKEMSAQDTLEYREVGLLQRARETYMKATSAAIAAAKERATQKELFG